MTVVRINAIVVPEGGGDTLAQRFAQRAGAVDDADGFLGFELLRPTDGRDTWLVVTHWRDEESFAAWVSSPAFAHGHRGVAHDADGAHGHEADGAHGHGGVAHGADGAHGHGAAAVATSSELWSYDVVDLSGEAARGA